MDKYELKYKLFDRDLKLLQLVLNIGDYDVFHVEEPSESATLIYNKYGHKIYYNYFNGYFDIIRNDEEINND